MIHHDEPRCHWVAGDRPRMIPTHQRHCTTPGCAGCQPCPERHCQLCNREHVTVDNRGTDETCASCLGDTRTHLHGIWTLSTKLLGEAIRRGINSHATALAGPSANPETYGYRRMSALAGRIDTAWLDDNRDELHPTWILGTWDMLARQHLGLDEPDHLTLTVARDLLDGHLTGLAHDGDFDFGQLAGDLKRCHAHLENVLSEGDRPDTGAPCPVCGRAELVRDYGKDPDDDLMWHCPKCDNWWTDANYRTRILGVYIGVADRLTASQIHQQYRVPEATVRKWVQRGKVHRRGKDDQGRLLYDVAEVIACRDALDASQSA